MNEFERSIIIALLFLLVGFVLIYSRYRADEYSRSAMQHITGFLLLGIGAALMGINGAAIFIPNEIRLATAAVLLFGGGGLLIHAIIVTEELPRQSEGS